MQKETYIEKFHRVEDIPLGTNVTLFVGPRLEALGSTSTEISAGLIFRKNFKIASQDYLFTRASVKVKDDAFNDKFANLELLYYFRYFKWHTLLFHTQVSYIESEVNRFRLGGTKGLRGYEKDTFKGRNRLLFNIEDRIYTFSPMLSGIIEPGFVLFVDLGNTWNDKSGDELREFHGGFGIGIRIALLKAPGVSMVRIDYGQQFDLNQKSVITVGMEGFF